MADSSEQKEMERERMLDERVVDEVEFLEGSRLLVPAAKQI